MTVATEKKIIVEPFNLNGLILKNKIVMAPMGRSRADDERHTVGDLQVTYYSQRASAGLIITEGTLISQEALGGTNLPGIYNQEQIEAWRLITDAIHSRGGRIFVQLWHTGRMSHPFYHNGLAPLAPSALNPNARIRTPDGVLDTITPREMSLKEVKQTILDFKQAAVNALKAGFDGVELQGGNGYLLHQFFSLYANQRTDAYGGSIENRARFLFELLDSFNEVFPINRVGIRLNPSQNDVLGMMLDAESIAVHEYIVSKLNDYDLAYLHLTEPFTIVDGNPFGISRIANHFRPLYKGTLIANGGYTPETAVEAIENGDADLVSFAKNFISNPDLVERIQHGWPLSKPETETFYTGGSKGYIDYPTYQDNQLATALDTH